MVKLKKGVKGAAKVKGKDETDEERIVRMEMQVLAAEEKARRLEDNARQGLRDRQSREQKYAHINGIKIHNQWRKIMRMAKVEELRKEIEILSQNHEREVDRKDAVIQMLDRDLEEAEEQYQMAVRGHQQLTDSLLDLQYQRMKALEAEFNSDLRVLQEEFEAERAEITVAHNRQKKDMADMMAAMESEFTEAQGEARQEFESAREEVKNRNSEEYNVLKIQLEGFVEELERHFEQAHKAYLESTEHRTQAFKQLIRSDAAAARIIEKRMKKLVRLQEALQHWRTKIATNSREWEERNRALRSEKDIMGRHYQALKRSMDGFRAAQGERLRVLALSAAACVEGTKKKLAKAQNILKLGELCRKFETEQEKVLPFHSPAEALGMVPEEVEDLEGSTAVMSDGPIGAASTPEPERKTCLSAHATNEKGENVEEWDYLNRFFKRFNKALLDKTAIEKERTRLDNENADLRLILKQYLDGISVNDDVMNNPVNPLMIVNQRLQVTLQERNRARAVMASQRPQQQLVHVQAISHT